MTTKSLIDLAIKLALNQNWKEAISVNQELLLENDQDVEALNRLAYAHLKSGSINLSKTTYKRVLQIDKYNPIANKQIKWLENLHKKDIKCDPSISSTPTIFLEEPGKTKIITLVHTAPARILCNFITAQKVYLVAKKYSIDIRDSKDTYIGALPDDLSHRLLRFIASGNEYDAYIKNIAKNCVSVFVREIKKGKKYHNIPSFQVTGSYGRTSTYNDKEDLGEVEVKPALTENED